MLNKSQYSLSTLQRLESFNVGLREAVIVCQSLLTVDKKEPPCTLSDTLGLGFFFTISEPLEFAKVKGLPRTDDQHLYFDIGFRPANRLSPETITNTFVAASEVERLLTIWLSMLQEYRLISLNEEEQIDLKYLSEFEQIFANDEPDAHVAPFDLQRQISIFNLIEFFEEVIKRHEDTIEVVSLLSEAKDFKENIQNLTKSAVVERLSRFCVAIRKKGIVFMKELFQEGKKFVYKKIIEGSLDAGSSMIDLLG